MKKWKDVDEVIKINYELAIGLRHVASKISKKPIFDKWNKKELNHLKM